MEPSDSSTAGVLRSSTAASVPTGGLSQATTATIPATSFALKGSGWYVTDYSRKGEAKSQAG